MLAYTPTSTRFICMKTCKQCSNSFEVAPEDNVFYQKMDVPAPTMCPDCRAQRRMAWRNERTLYKRKCDYSGKSIIAMYPEDAPFPVYDNEHWYGDSYDPFEHGKDPDFSRPIFEQIKELAKKVPRPAVDLSGENINSEYTNCAGSNKNCYLIFNGGNNENCLYSRGLAYCRDSMDLYFGTNNELCYECLNCNTCYNVQFSINAAQCSDSAFLFNCVGCKNCFGCSNLNHKEYYIFNKAYSKEEYEEFIQNNSLSNYQNIQKFLKEFSEIQKRAIHRENQNLVTENCTGNLIKNSKNCHFCFEMDDCEDCKFCDSVKYCKSSYDVFGFGYHSEQLYETVTTGDCIKAVGCVWCSFSSEMYYCQSCNRCSDCFACFGLNDKKYCILNKQYTKEEYEKLVPKIIEHMKQTSEWGEFFPLIDSPFAYNETLAQEFFPLSKDEVEANGWVWREAKDQVPEVENAIPAKRLPNKIENVPNDILNWAIECEISGRHYKITSLELKLYRQMGLAIPHLHPDERHKRRLSLRNPHQLFNRKCDKCQKTIRSTYSPSRPEKVYCEECYLKEIY